MAQTPLIQGLKVHARLREVTFNDINKSNAIIIRKPVTTSAVKKNHFTVSFMCVNIFFPLISFFHIIYRVPCQLLL